MAHLSFDDFLYDSPSAVAFRTAHRPPPQLTTADIDASLLSMREALRSTKVEKATSAVDDLEALVTARLQQHPAETRQVAVATIFQSRPELYDAVRQETTLTVHGKTLREIYTRAEAGTPSLTKAESVDAEVAHRVEILLAKTAGATREQALAFVFREHPDLAERWMRESYA